MSTLQISLEQQIAQLKAEIAAQESDVRDLREALVALQTGKPRPATPSADDTFELLRQLVGSVPENLAAGELYRAKLTEAQRTLQLAIASVEQKEQRLDALRRQQQGQQQEAAFEQLKNKALEFNESINKAMAELEVMRSLAKIAGAGKFEIAADLNELAYCSINESSVRLRRRFDVLRG